MILVALCVGATARYYYSYGILACIGFAALSLFLMQVLYFIFVLIAVWHERRRRQ
jgi:hypothetical protein